MGTTSTRKPAAYDVADDDALYDTRMPSSARRYRTYDTSDDPAIVKATLNQQRRARRAPSASQPPVTRTGMLPANIEKPARKGLRNPVAILLVGAVVAVALLMLVNVFSSWWQGFQDNLNYGFPRTSQLDAVVGHLDSVSNPTHFIFLNLRCNIQVIEIQGGDPANTKIYKGPTLYGSGCDTVPVKGEIRVEQGKRNLVLNIQSQQIVFENDGKTFKMRS
jgi:hypothetical protein